MQAGSRRVGLLSGLFHRSFTTASRLSLKISRVAPRATHEERERAMSARLRKILPALLLLLVPSVARGDTVIDWSAKAEAIGLEKRQRPPDTARGLAMMHVAMFEAVNAITRRYAPYRLALTAEKGASTDAAAASAAHGIMVALFPDQHASLDTTLKASLAQVPEGEGKANGVAIGKKAAAEILALRASDGISAGEQYRPVTTAGVYVPTVIPVSSTFGKVTPWVMNSGEQFRPAPPPPLTSDIWTADLNEIRQFGGRNSAHRTPEQTEIARFWVITGPHCWNPIVRQLAAAKKLDLTDSARLFALVSMATTDSFIAVFDAKYHYNLWRPVTAIRNADTTGNAATPREASWQPLVDTPMHPEYPCAHCISSSAAATVMELVLGEDVPEVRMTSPALPGVTRRWASLRDYSDEVSNARIYGGIHYRFSTVVAKDMGRQIGELTVKSQLLGASSSALPSR
jgi:hypothetical protein